MNAVTNISDEVAKRVFRISCIALIVTAMTFAIRAGILGDLGEQYGLSGEELGWITTMAFWGFPLAMIFGGALYNAIGAKLIVWLAFIGHALGLALTIIADGFWGLMISSFRTIIGVGPLGQVKYGILISLSSSVSKNRGLFNLSSMMILVSFT